MTENTTNEDTKEDKEAFVSLEAPIMPPDKSAQASYCVKTVQENSASLVRMWLVCITYLLPNLACGLAMTFSVTGLPHYQEARHDPESTSGNSAETEMASTPASGIVLDEDQGSWFVSIISLMMMIGTLLGGFVTEQFGCLQCLRISLLLEMAGWASIFWAKNFTELMVGRVLTGFGSGLGTPAAYLILTDLSLIRFRGMMATLNSFSNNFAWLIGLVIGKYCPLNVVILTYAMSPALFLILSPFLPESAVWLTKKGLEKEAVEALRCVRGPDYPVQVEMKELMHCVGSSDSNGNSKSLVKKMKYYFTAKQFITPLGIMLFLSVVQGSCGCDTISFYSLKIFRLARVSLDAYVMAILLQLGYTAGYLLIAPVMEKINRKHLFITACGMMTVALSILASNMPNADDIVVEDAVPPPVYVQMILPIAVFMFSVSYGAGMGPAIYTWSSELFPPRDRNVGCSLTLSVRHIVVGLVLKVYPWMLRSFGLAHLFSAHGVVLIIGICFVYFIVPETRGLTLTQLTTLFGGKLADDGITSTDKYDCNAAPATDTSSESTSLTSEEPKKTKETKKTEESASLIPFIV